MIFALQNQWHYFLTAVMFFTRVPVRFSSFDNADLNKATRYFPLIGILVGAVGALVFWLSDILLPLEIALLLSMASTTLLTGAFHEDGLADAVDGLGGGWSREQVLAIMVDSRIGSYGAIGLFLVLLTKYQALTYQWAALIPATLIAGHSLSRLCAVLVMSTQNYVKAEGKSKPLATQLTITELIIATFFGLVPLAFLEMKFLAALVPVAIVWLWFSAKIKSRIGGYTGDCLGAMQQLTEVAFYVGVLASTTLFSAP
ncbi:adenosylcobinamide-GDP ribazoletransferase [Methylotenera sp.]|uniref:adenosylcobinamide-GDP ribazoletransferase n=1 Tax=Methylotenera sp. TaxID=2051956 RepID=UPI0024881471|nr:adenosylcobinamide-GDP ribazoletransferase [Methylotenera sp.]MDI1298658.1 adenosylcobinamide-GDP ribazoletransferase [Methylotenera sp.]